MHYWCQSGHWQEYIHMLQRTLATSSWRTFALTFSARVEVNVIISESCSASEWTICRFGNILVMPCNFASKWHCLEKRVSSSLFISSCNNKNKTFKIQTTRCGMLTPTSDSTSSRPYKRSQGYISLAMLCFDCNYGT